MGKIKTNFFSFFVLDNRSMNLESLMDGLSMKLNNVE